MPSINGGYDSPSHAGSTRFGRNKEITDDFTLLQQAGAAIERSRKSASDGKTRQAVDNESIGQKVVTNPGLGV